MHGICAMAFVHTTNESLVSGTLQLETGTQVHLQVQTVFNLGL